MMSRIALVTGGAGFIGSHLIDRLLEKRWKVIVIDNLSSGNLENLKNHRNNPNIEIIIEDVKNLSGNMKQIKDVDVVFHYAANPEVRVSTINPRIHFNENIVSTFNLLEAMRKNDVEEFVFASSSSVYGEPRDIPVNENEPLMPVSVYGATKAACEHIIHAYSKLYGIRATVLRYANVIGPRLRHGVIYDFIRKLLKNKTKLQILGDGTQIRSYIHILDAIDATLLAYERSNENFAVYNVASEDWITVKEVADIVVKSMDLEKVIYEFVPTKGGLGWSGDVKRISLDITKLKSIGFKLRYNSRKAVKLTAEALFNELYNING